MANQDEEVYQLFLEEAREHLEDIESDLLQLEDQKDALDPDLINKVFRDIHTVKGGSSFFGLDKIQGLAHIMENLLGKIREGETKVTSELVSLLLDGADLLRQMVNNPQNMEEVSTDETLHSLESYFSNLGKDPGSGDNSDSLGNNGNSQYSKRVKITCLNDDVLFSVEKQELIHAQNFDVGANHIYLLYFDLIKDVDLKGKTPYNVISTVSSLTYFIDSKLTAPEVYLDDPEDTTMVLPFYILCSTVMDKDMLCAFVELPETQVRQIYDKAIGSIDEIPDEIFLDQDDATTIPVCQPQQFVLPQIEDDVDDSALCTPLQTETSPKKEPAFEKTATTQAEYNELTETPHIQPTVKTNTTVPSQTGIEKSASKTSSTVRISVDQLERLMNLAGELVLTRNELMQKVMISQDKSFLETAHKVDDITSEMQEAIMSTRMQSVGVVLSKFRRVVRDLSRKLHKEIDLTIIGEEVELDRTIVEAIGDPLTHIVRNAVDHGIEMPETREKAGKDPIGSIHIVAEHRAGQVVISISDNGGGINQERVIAKALENGIITEEALEKMSKRDINKLIFMPGFSTAEEVTDISGRGVGMDVVLSSLNAVGGAVDIESELGKGTTINISLPLTLAIMPSLLLESAGERFAIPQVHILELVRIKAAQVKERIERLGEAAVLRLRGDLLPLVRLSDILEMERYYNDPETGEMRLERRNNIADRRSPILSVEDPDENQSHSDDHKKEQRKRDDRRRSVQSLTHIAIVSSGAERYGIIVDSLLDSEEIVVKPLGFHLKDCKQFAGATILGDGQVALILDVDAIRNMAVLTSMSDMVEKVEEQERQKSAKMADVHQMLTLNYGKENLFAVPMDLVTRIEKINASQIEKIGKKLGMKYRDDTLVLIKLENVIHIAPLPEQLQYNVIVFEIGGKEVGLLSSEVHDISLPEGEMDGVTYVEAGILGTLIIDGAITRVLDLFEIGRLQLPELVTHLAETAGENRDEKTVLVVDDSPFFLRQLEGIVSDAGYNCISAEDGAIALMKLRDNIDAINLVITDIEMPNLNGLELASEIRADVQLSHLPIIACTTLSGIEAEQAGINAGVNEYLVKIDREQILSTCKKYLH